MNIVTKRTSEPVPAWHCGSGSIFFTSAGRWGVTWVPWHVQDGEAFFDSDTSTRHLLHLHSGRAPRWALDLLSLEAVRGHMALAEADDLARRRFALYQVRGLNLHRDVVEDATRHGVPIERRARVLRERLLSRWAFAEVPA